MPKKYQFLNGYVLVYKPKHSSSINSGGYKGYVYQHILIAEKVLNRSLKKGEVVHHLDLNRANNSPKNLIVVSERAHLGIHAWLRRGAPIAEYQKTLKSKATPYVKGEYPYSKVNTCMACNKIISNKSSSTCSLKCSRENSSKRVQLGISEDRLKKYMESDLPWTKIGRKLGVSDNGARKIAKQYGYDPKTRKKLDT